MNPYARRLVDVTAASVMRSGAAEYRSRAREVHRGDALGEAAIALMSTKSTVTSTPAWPVRAPRDWPRPGA